MSGSTGREAVIRGRTLIGHIHKRETLGHRLSTLPSFHYLATRTDGTNLGRVFWTAAEAGAALEDAP